MRSNSTEAGSSVRVLRHEFPAKGFGEDTGREPVQRSAGRADATLERVGVREERFNAADNLELLEERR